MRILVKPLMVFSLLLSILTLSGLLVIKFINSDKYLSYNMNQIKYIDNICKIEMDLCKSNTSISKLSYVCEDIITKENINKDILKAKKNNIYNDIYKRNYNLLNNELENVDSEALIVLTNKLSKVYVNNLFPTNIYNKMLLKINFLNEFIIFNIILLLGLLITIILKKFYSVVSITFYTLFILIGTFKYLIWNSKILINVYYQNKYISLLFSNLINNIINIFFILGAILLISGISIDLLVKYKKISDNPK